MAREAAAGMKLGRYTLEAPLGAGGMGVVYRAYDERLERAVAIKVLPPGVVAGEDRQRFRREGLALAKLSHPHIAAIYDVGEEDGLDYIVMELVPGQSLAEKLKGGPLAVGEATSIVLQVTEALEEAHEQGVVHRDLKPGNLMVTPKGQVKVLDFGIAKLLGRRDAEMTASMATRGLIGTPLYMSPEQVLEKDVDARTDLWSLGVIYYETLTGKTPFVGDSSMAVMLAITEKAAEPVSTLRPEVPPAAGKMVMRALEKKTADRYQSAAEFAGDASGLLLQMTAPAVPAVSGGRGWRGSLAVAAVALAVVCGAGAWLAHRSAKSTWARQKAIPEMTTLFATSHPLAGYALLEEAERYLPSDPTLAQIAKDNTTMSSITSSPAGARVEIQEYVTGGAWRTLGETPLQNIRVPNGYFRWRVSRAGSGEMLQARSAATEVTFGLDAASHAPNGMVPVPGGYYTDDIGFVGWVGPYTLPPYYMDKYEVSNREYQKFVDDGGYSKQQYWREPFGQGGRQLSWSEAMGLLRDKTGRSGPATWAGGHYPEGAADEPVSGVSWFEASAYAAYAGKQLPVFAQFFQTTPPRVARYDTQASNFSGSGVARVGQYQGLGPYGTFDTAGNVREWVSNAVDNDLRFILGGSWKSPWYMAISPEEASPWDRSEVDGFRCVRNTAPLPAGSLGVIQRNVRDFSKFKPANDEVFNAYKLLYPEPDTPLNATSEGIVKETIDWREEKVSFDAGYRGERMSAYLFLPKHARAPYQTVLFYPSARVTFLQSNQNGQELGDIKFFDYILQSGRAVMYPIYEGTYERQFKFELPSGSQPIERSSDNFMDAARSLKYLQTRGDIDASRIAYLGVSMGAAEGAIIATLLQDRLKTAVFLDGGYFLDRQPKGGDQADFAPRMKKPVLMVNGRCDYTFAVETAQNPMFAMLGTPTADKQHVLMDTPHDVTEDRPQLTKVVLDWLDKYLGRVDD